MVDGVSGTSSPPVAAALGPSGAVLAVDGDCGVNETIAS